MVLRLQPPLLLLPSDLRLTSLQLTRGRHRDMSLDVAISFKLHDVAHAEARDGEGLARDPAGRA